MRKLYILILLLIGGVSVYGDLIPTVVKIYDESEIEELENQGVRIERRRGDILLCLFPDSEIEEAINPDGESQSRATQSDVNKETPGIDLEDKIAGISLYGRKKINRRAGNLISPTLDEAVKFFDASTIQNGAAFSTGYTGKGVIAGICDIGIDPMHPTFLDEKGKSRIKRLTQYIEKEGVRIQLEGDEAYKEWVTDNDEKDHATHVAGIMAGGGAGSPYRGVAYDTDIVVSVSTLTDFGILMGVEDIIDYSKEVGKPAVINLSLGNNVGAHDGTSLFSQYLDMCAEDAIIVLSAGNEGGNTNTLSYSFETTDPLEFRIGNRAWDQKVMYGMTDIWNSSDRALKITIQIFDDENHEIVYEYEPQIMEDWSTMTYEWDPEQPVFPGLSLNGYLTITGGIDPENGRYEVALLYEYDSSRLIGKGWAKDMVSVKIEGQEGDEIQIFADGTYTRLMGVNGYPAPNSLLSISDLACGHNVVSVGMYTNRSTYPVSVFNSIGAAIDTRYVELGYDSFQTVNQSSYGTLNDGRQLPLTVGPGNRLVSAYSVPYKNAHPDEEYYQDKNGVSWIAMGGTSMSAPYVAGYIATWIEAFPELKVDDVKEMIIAGNSHNIPDPDNPRNINGYFNPVASLRYMMDKSGIDWIGNPGDILLPGDRVEVYSLSGIKIYEGMAQNLPKLGKGIYVVKTPHGVLKRAI